MKTIHRKMTIAEYDIFYEWSIKNHIRELIKENNISEEDALSQTKQELREMLPSGLFTDSNFLMTIKDSSSEKNVGFIWYLFEVVNEVQQCFLCDFMINESERRKGYATESILLMEKNAIQSGCKESVLFVGNENDVAHKLYTNCGYFFLRNLDDGKYLKKVII
jgi:predicted acetyltransferase